MLLGEVGIEAGENQLGFFTLTTFPATFPAQFGRSACTSTVLSPYYFSPFKKKFIFNSRINALQHWFDFCHTSTWISFRCTYVPSFENLPPTFSYPSSLLQSPSWSSLRQTTHFRWLAGWHMVVYALPWYLLRSSHPLLPSPPLPPLCIGLFSVSASPLLLCK